jgi:hypothetical protein
VVQFVVDLLKRKALDYDAAEIVGGFVDCGLMVQIADEISFRYKRFQEFFVAGYIRDNHGMLEEIQKGDNWIIYARDLDIYTARFRHEQPLLDFSKSKLKSIDIPDPDLTVAQAKEYLSGGLDPSFTQFQLQRMKKQKMTATKIDRLMDMADREYVEERQKARKETKGGVVAKGTKILHFYLALEMYSQCVRNLEFVDRDIKRQHLQECLAGWEKALRGNLYAIKEAFRALEKQIPDSGLVDEELTEEKVIKFLKSLEALFRGVMPSFISVYVYQNLGSEKLTDLLGELAEDPSVPVFRRLLCGFVLLELDALNGINRIEALCNSVDEKWLVHIVTQRLFQYYRSRPLSQALRNRFEELVSNLEIRVRGEKPAARGQVITELKKHAFSDGRDPAARRGSQRKKGRK